MQSSRSPLQSVVKCYESMDMALQKSSHHYCILKVYQSKQVPTRLVQYTTFCNPHKHCFRCFCCCLNVCGRNLIQHKKYVYVTHKSAWHHKGHTYTLSTRGLGSRERVVVVAQMIQITKLFISQFKEVLSPIKSKGIF